MAQGTIRRTAAGKRGAARRKIAAKRKTTRKKAAGAALKPASASRAKSGTARKTAARSGKAAARSPKKAAARRKAAAAPRKMTATPRKAAAARKTAAAPRKASRKAAANPTLKTRSGSQRFTVSHLREEDFLADGLRPYARYRDLGITAATEGLARAHVIRMVPPVTSEVRQRHTHDVELQLVYVLRGWLKNEFEGHGVQMMEQGSCWLQPPGIPHTVLDYSDDCEVLEIIIPADFDTQSTE